MLARCLRLANVLVRKGCYNKQKSNGKFILKRYPSGTYDVIVVHKR